VHPAHYGFLTIVHYLLTVIDCCYVFSPCRPRHHLAPSQHPQVTAQLMMVSHDQFTVVSLHCKYFAGINFTRCPTLSLSNAVLLDVEILYETVPVKRQNDSTLNKSACCSKTCLSFMTYHICCCYSNFVPTAGSGQSGHKHFPDT